MIKQRPPLRHKVRVQCRLVYDVLVSDVLPQSHVLCHLGVLMTLL